MLIIKKLTKQCAPCPSASIMILQKGRAISLEGRRLVLTLLASKSNKYVQLFHVKMNEDQIIIFCKIHAHFDMIILRAKLFFKKNVVSY